MGEGLAPLSNTRKSQRRSDYVGWGLIPSGVFGGKEAAQRDKKRRLGRRGVFFFFVHAPYASLMFF